MGAEVILLEDDAAMLALLLEELNERGHRARGSADPNQALTWLREDGADVLVTDLNLARSSGLDVCRSAIGVDPELPVIIITAFGSMEAAIGAIRAGAFDFITKPFSVDSLEIAVKRAARMRALAREVEILRTRVRSQQRPSRLDGISPAISRLRAQIEGVASTDATVLLLGESGSGKERAARELHELSRRAEAPFIAESVAAIPPNLLESTLFGHVRGSFTGATGPRSGLFRSAHGGTLLLDEIGELPLELQPKLLRVLEERQLRPVGSDAPREIDVRVITATHRDLGALVREGRFRADLYYRLAVIELEVPALRERGRDILLLTQRFIAEFAQQNNKQVRGLHPETAARLLSWSWPGNVRELRNVVQRAVILARRSELTPEDLPTALQEAPFVPLPAATAEDILPLAEVERQAVLSALERCGGNKAMAARALGIGRKTLYRKLEAWGMGQDDTAQGD